MREDENDHPSVGQLESPLRFNVVAAFIAGDDINPMPSIAGARFEVPSIPNERRQI